MKTQLLTLLLVANAAYASDNNNQPTKQNDADAKRTAEQQANQRIQHISVEELAQKLDIDLNTCCMILERGSGAGSILCFKKGNVIVGFTNPNSNKTTNTNKPPQQ